MPSHSHTVDSEYADGSCGHSEHADQAQAEQIARDYAAEHPHARVWLDGVMIQRGFVAADEEAAA